MTCCVLAFVVVVVSEESLSPRITGISGHKPSEDFSNVVVSSFETNISSHSGGSAYSLESTSPSLDVRDGAYQNFNTPTIKKKSQALVENPGSAML